MARSKSNRQTGQLLCSSSRQNQLFENSHETEFDAHHGQSVQCLGLTFENDEARRAHFLRKLKEGLDEIHTKLHDIPFTSVDDTVARLMAIETWPIGDEVWLRRLAARMRDAEPSKDLLQRWKDEVGFPHGEIRDILDLSDPPYYVACPNPFLREFVARASKSSTGSADSHRQEPFAADVSSGKSDPFYNVHAYPTKVPPDAIQPLLEHYAHPTDVVLDPFSGTGMTGVAMTRCQDLLGVLQDLSPIATHIAVSLNAKVSPELFKQSASELLNATYSEYAWMYQTEINGKIADVRYFVWSDSYLCDSCGTPIRIWDIEGEKSVGGLKTKAPCPHCNAMISKQTMDPLTETIFDPLLGHPIEKIRSEPVLKIIVERNRSQKIPVDQSDKETLQRVYNTDAPSNAPTEKMLFKDNAWGDQWRSSYHLGVTHLHHFFTYRNFIILCDLWRAINLVKNPELRRMLRFWFTASMSRMTRLNRYMAQHNRHVGPLTGTLFIGPIQAEISPFYFFDHKIRELASAFSKNNNRNANRLIISTSSSSMIDAPADSIDMIFTDPPFGGNLMYSELNFIVEGWFRVYTNQKHEAVISATQGKRLSDYQNLMEQVFSECYRVLKPGRWMVVEFHNSRHAVWTAIQEAISNSGLVVADVRTLDKEKGTTKQLTQAGTVKQDLIISAYKPDGGVEETFRLRSGTEESVWDFVRAHLAHLPVFVATTGQAEAITERQDFLLFDRMVAFHVQRGVTVSVSASEFYGGLAQRFPERDGMYFLPDQVAEYDKKRMSVKEVLQLEIFVIDESSAIQWLRRQLGRRPQTFQSIHPQFLREIGGWQKHEGALELSELLEQSFLRYDGTGEVPSQIHSYLSTNFRELRNLPKNHPSLCARAKDRWYVPDPNKAGDLERLRERTLLREFEEYRPSTQKRLRVFRLEAVRAGFKRAWQNRDYETIIAVARKVPEEVLREDPKLLMWYDQALTRIEAA